jgi:hypothetical protein
MKSKTPTPALKSWPRLILEAKEVTPAQEVGFLQVSSTAEKLEVGSAESREFRLVQCLFSPQNFITAKYSPVIQTYERVFTAIRNATDAANERLLNEKSAQSEMTTIVQKSMRLLQKSEAGKYLSFVTVDDKLRMDIAGVVIA